MTIGSGLGATFGVATEGTVGTFQVPTQWDPFLKEGLKLKKNTVQSKALRGILYNLASKRAYVTRTVDGAVDLELADRGLSTYWKHMLGQAPVSIVQIGSSGVYQHVHQATPTAGAVGLSLSAQIGRPQTNGTIQAFSYPGLKVTDWSVDVKTGAIGGMTVTFDGWDELTAPAYAAPSYVTNNPLYFTEASLLVGGTPSTPATTIAAGSNAAVLPQATINVASTTGFPTSGVIYVTTASGTQYVTYTGTTSTTFTGCAGGAGAMSTGGAVTAPGAVITGANAIPVAADCTMTGKNPLDVTRYFLGASGKKAEQLPNNLRDITGAVTVEFENLTDVYNAFAADTPSALQLNFQGPIVGTDGATRSGMQVLIPRIYWDDAAISVDGPGILKQPGKFSALYDGANVPIQVTLQTLDAVAN